MDNDSVRQQLAQDQDAHDTPAESGHTETRSNPMPDHTDELAAQALSSHTGEGGSMEADVGDSASGSV